MDRLRADGLAALGAKARPARVVEAASVAMPGRRWHRRAARCAELRAYCLGALAVRARDRRCCSRCAGSSRGRATTSKACASACKARCWRRDRALRLSSRSATELAPEAKPRSQEDPGVTAAALGHACSSAESHLACRVLVETAGEAAIRGVLG
jgi:hypothetical protein